MTRPILTIVGRYQINDEPIGQGGMGVVYKAWDPVTNHDVALKTMRGAIDNVALELFAKEWNVLSRINHPNIVDIFDTGEFEEGGQRKPFFVMPYLRGCTLDYLIHNASQRLTVERVVEIMLHTCRGLQAAHEHNLVHRDVKPSNIFVMEDDTVKVIDFGVAHLAGADTVTGIKGTLQYMSPEQLEMKPVTPASDIFSLAVVCYEALTGKKPFVRRTEAETIEAIRHHVPPPVCEIKPVVSQLLSRVIHKALAKAPYHRFSTAREFAEALQKAINNQPIERFDKSKTQPRIERARKAQTDGDLQFASEVLAELEAEGHFDPEMTVLRMQIDQAIRQKSIRQLLDSARTRREEDELPLALQKIREVLEIDPKNVDALALRSDIEKERSEWQVENWFRLAEQHLHHRSFSQARQALQEVLKIEATDARAREALLDVDRREQEINRIRSEKEQLYQDALNSYQNGEISSALSKLEKVLEFNNTAPDTGIPDRDAQYQGFYNQIRTERDAAETSYAEGRRCLADGNFDRAAEICDEFLRRYPGDARFQALKLEAEENRRQERSSFIADVARRVETEPDLDRRVNILKEAVERYPDEPYFQQSLRLTRDRRDLVNSIIARARRYEERSAFAEALGQWDILRNIYAQYPGIDFEVDRLTRRRDEQLRTEAKARWADQIDRTLACGDYTRARDLVRTALEDFPDDKELAGLGRLSQQALERANEAATWLQKGQELLLDRQFEQGIEAVRKAATLDPANPAIHASLLNALLEQARSLLGQDWRAAEPLIQEAVTIDAGHPLARSLKVQLLDYKRQEIVNESLLQARELQAAGNIPGAIARLDEALKAFPNELRLAQLRSTLAGMNSVSRAAAPPAPIPQPPAADPEPPPVVKPVGSQQAQFPEETFNGTASLVSEPNWDTSVQPFLLPQVAPVPRAGETKEKETQRSPLAEAARPAEKPEKPAVGRRPVLQFTRLQWIAFGLFPVIVGIAILASNMHPGGRPPTAPPPHKVPVRVAADVQGAEIMVDGARVAAFPLQLLPGRHTAEARRTGYRTVSRVFTVASGASGPLAIALHPEPELIRLRFSSDLGNGQVTIDGEPRADLQDGAFIDDHVALSGEHKLVVTRSGQEYFALTFRAEPGNLVSLSSPLKTGDYYALVISNLGTQTRLYSNSATLKAGLAGQTPQPIPPEGLAFDNLRSDSEFSVGEADNFRSFPAEIGNAPALSVVLSGDPSTTTVRVESSVNDADVTIQGRKPRHIHGAATTLLLAAGTYTVRVSKDGYTAETRTVELKKGQTLKLPVFDLKPAIQPASLEIEGGTPGAEVSIDGQNAGSISPDGGFSKESIAAGDHSVTLKKVDFEGRELQKTFTAGKTLHIDGVEARLTAFATVIFQVVPATATVSWKRDQEAQTHSAANGTTIRLPAGHYSISASAADRKARSESMNLSPGAPHKIDWLLDMVEKTAPPPPPVEHLFDSSRTGFRDGGWEYHQGKGTVWLAKKEGVFRLIVKAPSDSRVLGIRKGGRLEWNIDWKDARNRIQYVLERKSLERTVFRAGKPSVSAKTSVNMGAGSTWNLDIEIHRNQIVIRSGGRVLDAYDRPDTTEPLGRSGFEGEVEVKPE